MGAAEPLCLACARERRTCCQIAQVYVTAGDVSRIAAHVGRDDFYGFVHPDDPDYADHPDDPLWLAAVFRADGRRRILTRGQNDECPFLGPRGCALDVETRPLVCRLYPFRYTEAGLGDLSAHHCPTHLLPVGACILSALGMDRAAALRWHALLYDELRAELGGLRAPAEDSPAKAWRLAS